MGRKNPSSYQEVEKLVTQYEAIRTENKQFYLDADQFAAIADHYAGARKFKEAQEVITYGLQMHSRSTELLIEQAYLYLDTRKIRQAQEIADSITESFLTEVKMLKAEIFLNKGSLESAKDILNTVEDQDDLDVITDIVYLYMDMGYPENAKEWLDKGTAEYSDNEEYIAITADYLVNTNQATSAAIHYNRLIDIDPFNAAYWMGLAKCRFAEEEWDKVVECCDFALAADDKYGEAYMFRAHCYFYLNNMESAIADYHKSIECKIMPPEMGYMFIGMSYSNIDKWEESDKYFRICNSYYEDKDEDDAPMYVNALTNWAITTFNLGNQEEAHQLCEKAKKIDPKDVDIYLTEGKLYLHEGLNEEALESFEQAIEISPSIEIWFQIANSYSESDMLKDAMKYYEKVYEINPKYGDVTDKLSILSLIYNKIDDFFKYNRESPEPISETYIQDILSRQDNTTEGSQMLKEVLERMRKEKGK